MPSSTEISKESDPFNVLNKYIKILTNGNKSFEGTGRNTIIYYSAWLTKDSNKGTSISDLDKNLFMDMIHGLDRTKGLDLFLHTPGGEIAATESLIDYLYEMFEGNIRAIIPQMAMSGGTMIACSCKEIIMGKQSSLGPIDPQIGSTPAQSIIDEFERIRDEIKENPKDIAIWNPILSKYPITIIETCYKAVIWSEEILNDSLKRVMFKNEDQEQIDQIKTLLGHKNTKSHSRHLNPKKCQDAGLKIKMMEEMGENKGEDGLQDTILSIHHACINLLMKNPKIDKIMANNNGKSTTVSLN